MARRSKVACNNSTQLRLGYLIATDYGTYLYSDISHDNTKCTDDGNSDGMLDFNEQYTCQR